MRFLVPQNIDLEDRVIGPFTLKQFVYLMIGGMVDYLIYVSLAETTSQNLIYLALVPPSLIALAFARLTIQERPFAAFLASAVLYWLEPKRRLWQRAIKENSRPDPVEKEQGPRVSPKKISRSELEKLAEIVDARGWNETDRQGKLEANGKNLAGRVLSSKKAKRGFKFK